MAEGSPGEIIGRNVRAVREAQLFSRPELARRSGVSLAGIDHLERGLSARPRRSTVEKLAKALGVDVEVLTGDAPLPLGAASTSQGKLFNNGVLGEERRETGEQYMRMQPDEFDELRRAANAGEIDGAKFHEAVLHAYNAAEAEYRKLQHADALEEDLEEARELYREARKRWWVVDFDRAESTIALDERRDPEVVERADTRRLPLDEAYEEVRGRLGVTA